MTITPLCYYFIRGLRGAGNLRAVKVVEPPRDGVVLAKDVMTAKPVRPGVIAFVKQTNKVEIARVTGKNVDLIL